MSRTGLLVGIGIAVAAGAGWLWLQGPNREPEPELPLTLAETERKIRAAVTREGDMISVYDPLLPTIFVMPTTTKWAVQCGLTGFRVRFARDSDDGLEVVISYVGVPTETCRTLAPAAARVVQGIVAP